MKKHSHKPTKKLNATRRASAHKSVENKKNTEDTKSISNTDGEIKFPKVTKGRQYQTLETEAEIIYSGYGKNDYGELIFDKKTELYYIYTEFEHLINSRELSKGNRKIAPKKSEVGELTSYFMLCLAYRSNFVNVSPDIKCYIDNVHTRAMEKIIKTTEEVLTEQGKTRIILHQLKNKPISWRDAQTSSMQDMKYAAIQKRNREMAANKKTFMREFHAVLSKKLMAHNAAEELQKLASYFKSADKILTQGLKPDYYYFILALMFSAINSGVPIQRNVLINFEQISKLKSGIRKSKSTFDMIKKQLGFSWLPKASAGRKK